MKVGFTGTRKGMTDAQKREVRAQLVLLRPYPNPGYTLEAHHGDCVGADVDFGLIAHELSYLVKTHPATDTGSWRANSYADEVLAARPALARNRDIVNASEVVLATPKGFYEEFRGSGTWAAIRYAKLRYKHFAVVYPDGRVVWDTWDERVGEADR